MPEGLIIGNNDYTLSDQGVLTGEVSLIVNDQFTTQTVGLAVQMYDNATDEYVWLTDGDNNILKWNVTINVDTEPEPDPDET